MKRIFATFILIIAIVFCFGCTTYSANKFNDLKFEDKLSDKDMLDILEKTEEAFVSFSKITISFEEFEKYGQLDNKEKAELTIKAYNNFLVVCEGKHTEKVDENGISYNKTSSVELDLWADDAVSKIILLSNNDGEENYSVYLPFTEENADTAKNRVYQYFYDFLENIIDDDFENLDAYKLKGGGYALAVSNKNESYTPVSWGNETKERYNLNESQIVVIIDKDYRITEITMYSASSTNRDPDTNEWYSSTKKISGSSASIKVSYSSRNDNTEKASSLSDAYKKYLDDEEDE